MKLVLSTHCLGEQKLTRDDLAAIADGGVQYLEIGKPLTSGPPTHGQAESNFLSLMKTMLPLVLDWTRTVNPPDPGFFIGQVSDEVNREE